MTQFHSYVSKAGKVSLKITIPIEIVDAYDIHEGNLCTFEFIKILKRD